MSFVVSFYHILKKKSIGFEEVSAKKHKNMQEGKYGGFAGAVFRVLTSEKRLF